MSCHHKGGFGESAKTPCRRRQERTAPNRRRITMRLRTLTAVLLGAALLATGQVNAQQPAAPPNLDAIPEKMPFNNAYGVPISLQHAHGKSFTNSTGSRSRRATFDRSTTSAPPIRLTWS